MVTGSVSRFSCDAGDFVLRAPLVVMKQVNANPAKRPLNFASDFALKGPVALLSSELAVVWVIAKIGLPPNLQPEKALTWIRRRDLI